MYPPVVFLFYRTSKVIKCNTDEFKKHKEIRVVVIEVGKQVLPYSIIFYRFNLIRICTIFS